MTTTGTDWAHVFNDRLRADITGPMRQRWNDAMAAQFSTPQLTEIEKESAALRVANHLASDGGSFRRKVTLADMLEQIAFSRRTAGNQGGMRETLEDAVCSIMRDACPHFRFSRAMAPSRSKYRAELMEALARAGKPVERDIRKHTRFMQRPADPFVRDQMGDLIERHAKAGTLDEDVYLREVERLLAGARMERIAAPDNDHYARVSSAAAAGVARPEVARAADEEIF